MATNDEMVQQFLQTLQSQQEVARPNALQGFGAGLSGFAAPFLGQTWTNPYKNIGASSTKKQTGLEDITKVLNFKKAQAEFDQEQEVAGRQGAFGQLTGELQTEQDMDALMKKAAEGMKTYTSPNEIKILSGLIENAKSDTYKNKEFAYKDEERQAKKLEADKLKQGAKELAIDTAKQTLRVILDVEKGKDYFGALGGFPSLPTDYDRKLWETSVENLVSKQVLDLMSALKNVSKTGATGFGQLSEKELALLQKASTRLNRGLSPDDAMEMLGEIKAIAMKVLGNPTADSGYANAGSKDELSDDDAYELYKQKVGV